MVRLGFVFSMIATITVSTSALAQSSSVQTAVDDNLLELETAVDEAGATPIASIDHSRLAKAEGVEMPASRVLIFSDPEINTPVLEENVRAGLDLPFRVLSFDQDGRPQIVYTDSQFIKVRHDLNNTQALNSFQSKLLEVLKDSDAAPAPTNGLNTNYGIIELRSQLSVTEAVKRLRATVMEQNDTVWFGEIDFATEASLLGVELPDTVLLLFGGPAPGGVAMAGFPAIGLDAFCQKLLVYAHEEGGSVVIFNDIAALAELHYGSSAEPHHGLNKRLTATFRTAIE
ncbi:MULTISPECIES: DUF302 domain-containing protein [unclassified Ruegeria]|uniref:DUF302 domain-containing protein n=1 Tax=unclassified Ruegeria TaxID=2625375 RepID=UPI00149143E7|nr:MULTISPECIES: DUF302 domain-containing protein [unclassified Ruegeria]NOD78759.1 DUF302 domain-containing protein [Ruegeria sp. HKCCD4332]NOD91090.1 DUF302 domain-containing protein [Ruegeria sp. HKCCD4318]NOE16247.1 DUF302 domain-containing protein [Ruegeria sp. HKCCD4318-2]NOG07446.1 DUF302 domain-containing protein [Ruegeria sp. HKCCD4315]